MDKNPIVDEFVTNELLFNKFSDKVNLLVKEILNANNINPHQIICRVKGKKSLFGKVSRKKEKYNSLSDITDIVGLRIISYFEDEVDKIAEIIEKEFEVDPINSIDKRVLDADKFGYRSLHYVISLSKERLKLTENKSFANLKAEIQVRSILQHAWAEIEHDIGYKGEIEIPLFAKRSFYRIAALLETADIEFVKLKNTLKKYESEVSKSIIEKPEEVLLDKASLKNFIRFSPIVRDIEAKLKKILGSKEIDETLYNLELTLPRLIFFKIKSIKELEILLQKNEKIILQFIKNLFRDVYKTGFPRGISLFHLAYILASEDENFKITSDFCNEFQLSEDMANQLIENYKKTVIDLNIK